VRKQIEEDTEKLCGALSDLGFEFHWEADNRGGKNSRYIMTRRPIAAKIRVSDHPSPRVEKEKARSKCVILDVGPHALSWQAALSELQQSLAQ
jgi:hypothetical protein